MPDEYAGRRVLVTGASGFIGARLARALVTAGAEVHGVARTAGPDGNVRWHAADLADADAAAQVVRDSAPDTVFHLASHVSGARALDAVLPTVRANLLSTVDMLVAAAGLDTPPGVVLAGSMEEPGGSDAATVPGSPYAAAKAAASGYARMFHALYSLPVVTLRVFMVYGPGRQDEAKLVPYVTRSLLNGDPPRLSSGARAVDWVYVDDVVAAFVAAGSRAAADEVAGRVIDVGSGELTTIRSLVERVAGLVGGEAEPQFGALPDRPLEREPRADHGPARDLLGWAPQTPLDEGLARTVAWFRDQDR
jgi:UDP-glucose 4-epimerase